MSSVTDQQKDARPAPNGRDRDRPDPCVFLARKIGRESLPVRTRHLASVIARLYDEHLGPVGLTANQFEILAFVGTRERTTMTDVAGQLQLDGPTLGRTIQSMVESRWMKSELNAEGMTEVAWTSQGRRIFERAMPAWKRAQYAATDVLGADGACVLTSHGAYTALW